MDKQQILAVLETCKERHRKCLAFDKAVIKMKEDMILTSLIIYLFALPSGLR